VGRKIEFDVFFILKIFYHILFTTSWYFIMLFVVRFHGIEEISRPLGQTSRTPDFEKKEIQINLLVVSKETKLTIVKSGKIKASFSE